MSDKYDVVINPEIYIKILTAEIAKRDKEIARLNTLLEYERGLRKNAEAASSSEGDAIPVKKTRKQRDVSIDNNSYSDYKSNGIKKAHAAESIRSFQEFKNIQEFYLRNNRVRDWAMWTIGVSLGFRVSDLLSLRFRNLIEPDKRTFKKRIQIYEIKTGKLNNCLITESVIDAMTKYLDSIKWEFDLDGFLFPSKKTKGKMYEECGWRILSDAGKALNLPIVIGSHTMRKSFANIAACVDKSSVDMNSITKVQGLLNHSDQRVTMSYLGSYQTMFDKARIAVSDFILGKTGINEIVAGNQYTIDDVFERLDNIEKMLI